MEFKKCPKCMTKSPMYNQFCPKCDFDFNDDLKQNDLPEISKNLSGVVGFDIKCPSCGKPIKNTSDECPWCDIQLNEKKADATGDDLNKNADRKEESQPFMFICSQCGGKTENAQSLCPRCQGKKINAESDPVSGQGASEKSGMGSDSADIHTDSSQVMQFDCPECHKTVQSDFKVCNYCGFDLTNIGPLIRDEMIPPAPIPDGIHSFPQVSPQIQNTDIQSIVPYITILFNAGKKYKEKRMDFLEFQICNYFSQTIKNLKITIRSRLLKMDLIENISVDLAAGMSFPVNVSGFNPQSDGRDPLLLQIKGSVSEFDTFHLFGNIPIDVLPLKRKESVTPNIKISNSIIDEDAFSKFGHDEEDFFNTEVEQWVNVKLFLDIKKQKLQSRFFPKKCVETDLYFNDPKLISSLRALSPEKVPKAILSTEEGMVYYLLPGRNLLIGRNSAENIIPLSMFPEIEYAKENKLISKYHCHIFVKNKRTYIRNTSQTGIKINNKLVPKNQSTMLHDKEIIVFPNGLEIQLNIFTDGRQIIAVLLKRINNKTNHQYLLAAGPVYAGDKESLPIFLNAGTQMPSIFYFHPHYQSWCLRSEGSSQDTKLEDYSELLFGTKKYWFSCRYRKLRR